MPQDILITPGSGEPQILFTGSGVRDTSIALNVLSSYQSASRSGTALVFEGTEGQLFAITDNLSSGTIFGVGDVTGLPLLRIDASGDVTLAEFGRFVGVGTGVPRFNLDVRGTGNFSTAIVSNNATFNGSVGISQNTPGAKMHVNTLTSTNKGLIVQGAAAQSANLQEWQNSAGSVLALVDKDGDVTAATGTFTFLQLTSSIPRQSGLFFLDNNGILSTSTNFIHDRSNLASPRLLFKASGIATPDISLNVLTSASGSTSGVQTLSFEGSAGQLFSISDVLNSGTIFSVNDISGLPMLEVDATGLVSLARFGTGINAHRTINALQGISGTNGTFSGTVTTPNILGSSNLIYVGQNQTFSWEFDTSNSNPAIRFTWGGAASAIWGSSGAVNISIQGVNGFRVAPGQTNIASTLGIGSVSSPNVFLRSDSGNALDIRNGANAQRINIYNAFTDASNYERGYIAWSSNIFRIGTEKAGTGIATNLELQADGITKAVFRTGTGSLCQINNGDIAFGTGNAANTTGDYFFIGPANHSLLISNNDVGLVVQKTGTLYVGGFYRNSVRNGLITGAYAYDTNIVAGSLVLQGGASTGNATPSKIIFRATASIASGTTNQTHSTVFEVTDSTKITIFDSVNIILGTTTGTKIGTATTQKIGFYDKTPVVQPAAVADATDAASVITQLNLLLSRMRDLGLIAS